MTKPTLLVSREEAQQQGSGTQPWQPTAAAVLPERPALAPTVQLVGETHGTGFTEPQWLLQRDGRFIQVTELLYRVVEYIDGQCTLEEIAARMTAATDWIISADNVRQLIQTKLIPLGLIATEESAVMPHGADRGRSPLQVNLRRNIVSPRFIDPLTRILQILYTPPVLLPVLLTVVIAHGWLYFMHGVADSVRAALYTPGGLLIVLGIALASGVFHEFGHAAALRYGGGQVRGMGVGFYLIYPTFYTDVTDSYRLGRWARLRTDLGGIYFHLIFVLALMALYFLSGEEVLLAVVMVINIDIMYQCLPYARLDGYWALADLTGIPDFFSQMGPFVRSVMPRLAGKGSKLPSLKPWVKAVFALYIIFTVPVLALLAFLLIRNFPRFMATSWDVWLYQTRVFSTVQNTSDWLAMAAVASQILLLTLSILAGIYLMYSVSATPLRALWNWSKPTLLRRIAGALIMMGSAGLVGILWIPELSSASKPPPAGVQSFEVTERVHVQMPVDYPQTPPVGGNHAPIWQNCGFYAVPIANENAVHSLEHGAVWITYRADVPQEEVKALHQLARRQPYVLVSPLPDGPAPVVASAWGHQLQLDSSRDPRLSQFIRTFRLGLQAPERGGPCTQGVGMPQK
jgi:putative peptide zinc metalloprotease protein